MPSQVLCPPAAECFTRDDFVEKFWTGAVEWVAYFTPGLGELSVAA